MGTVFTGASFRSLRLTVTVPDPVTPPESVTSTMRSKEGLVSKSSGRLDATVICPVTASMAKAPPVLPPVMA